MIDTKLEIRGQKSETTEQQYFYRYRVPLRNTSQVIKFDLKSKVIEKKFYWKVESFSEFFNRLKCRRFELLLEPKTLPLRFFSLTNTKPETRNF